MRKEFEDHLEGVAWITENAINEAHFEILREEMSFNYIDTGEYFIRTLQIN